MRLRADTGMYAGTGGKKDVTLYDSSSILIMSALMRK